MSDIEVTPMGQQNAELTEQRGTGAEGNSQSWNAGAAQSDATVSEAPVNGAALNEATVNEVARFGAVGAEIGDFRAGFVAIVGRPNAGKSTLTNALVGQKIAITANQPETTRKVIRGIVNRDAGQLIVVDTPGLHRPRTLLGERLNDMVHETLADVDAVALCLPADEALGPGDEFLLNLVRKARVPIVAVVTKKDRISREALAMKLIQVDQFGDFAQIVPVSAVERSQLSDLVSVLLELMPPSPALYPTSAVTDESDEDLIAEFIREAALEGVREELPHSIAVTIDEIILPGRRGGRDDVHRAESMRRADGTQGEGKPRAEGNHQGKHRGTTKIHASLYVERDSQKGIIIGRKGARLREVGRVARAQIEELLGTHVFLDLHVKVAKEWQRNPKLLGKLGF
ncbi:MAG: GTPase Era [Arcanobacterium sp.]|nr:GTPase Era [Arcanobacterium sp.]